MVELLLVVFVFISFILGIAVLGFTKILKEPGATLHIVTTGEKWVYSLEFHSNPVDKSTLKRGYIVMDLDTDFVDEMISMNK